MKGENLQTIFLNFGALKIHFILNTKFNAWKQILSISKPAKLALSQNNLLGSKNDSVFITENILLLSNKGEEQNYTIKLV